METGLSRDDRLLALLEVQTKTLTAMSQRAQTPSTPAMATVLKVNPNVKWPRLGDDATERDVKDFYEKYKDIFQLPNDGRGMLPADRLKTLRQCLDGYKEKIYVLHMKKHRKLGTLEKDPDAVCQEIKSRHMKFVESDMEREMRVTAAWDNLWMGGKSALEFEAAFEEAVMELELVGLTKNQQ